MTDFHMLALNAVIGRLTALETKETAMLAAALAYVKSEIIAAKKDTNAASGWQPIATAPRDGRFLFWTPSTSTPQGGVSCICENGISSFWYLGNKPTHWMPLPAPPAPEGGE